MSEIEFEFIGVVIRTTDGTTRALDLSGKDVKLNAKIDTPLREDDLIDVADFGNDDRIYLNPFDRIEVAIDGTRRPDADQLFVYRVVEDGEAPFPAWERSE